MEEEVRTRTRGIREAHLEIVRRLSRAGEFRDTDTGEHLVRMSRVAEVLARRMGLDESACDMILNACPMHDIGKIAIPDSVLLKKGPLTSEEWGIMKTHPIVGCEILGETTPRSLSGPRHRWPFAITRNGTEPGIPYGLKGEAIPFVARIAAVSDVFDALTSARPYKDAWPVQDAVEHIRSQSGKHFDPRVVDAFMDMADEIVAIREEHPGLLPGVLQRQVLPFRRVKPELDFLHKCYWLPAGEKSGGRSFNFSIHAVEHSLHILGLDAAQVNRPIVVVYGRLRGLLPHSSATCRPRCAVSSPSCIISYNAFSPWASGEPTPY